VNLKVVAGGPLFTAEYDKFEVRRREYKEALGEAETIKQLEQAAKMLDEGTTNGGKKPK
jgi:hypothetical protein